MGQSTKKYTGTGKIYRPQLCVGLHEKAILIHCHLKELGKYIIIVPRDNGRSQGNNIGIYLHRHIDCLIRNSHPEFTIRIFNPGFVIHFITYKVDTLRSCLSI